MTKIVQKPLPNAISFEDVSDQTVRQKIMLLKENIACIAAQLSTAQTALTELQARQGNASQNVDTAGILSQAAQDAADKVAAHAADGNIHVTGELQTLWTGKYGLPAGGIPKSDLSQEVQDLLDNPSSTVAAHASTHGKDGSDPISPADIGAAPEGFVAVQTFSAKTSSTVKDNASETITVSVTKLGYTPALVGHICCYGDYGSYTNTQRWACAAFTCTAASIQGNNITLTIDKNASGVRDMRVSVSFTVMYLKNTNSQQ